MRPQDWMLVALGGALGAPARVALTLGVKAWLGHSWPAGTLVVNLLGCFLIGVVLGPPELVAQAPGPLGRALLALGFLGAFTTFSTFGYETLALWRDGYPLWAVGYAMASVALGVVAVWGGTALVRG